VPTIPDKDGQTALYMILEMRYSFGFPVERLANCFALLLPHYLYKQDGHLRCVPHKNRYTVNDILEVFGYDENEELTDEERTKKETIVQKYPNLSNGKHLAFLKELNNIMSIKVASLD